jgi:hypothetical protein
MAGASPRPNTLMQTQFSSKKRDVANLKVLRIPHKGKQLFRDRVKVRAASPILPASNPTPLFLRPPAPPGS